MDGIDGAKAKGQQAPRRIPTHGRLIHAGYFPEHAWVASADRKQLGNARALTCGWQVRARLDKLPRVMRACGSTNAMPGEA